MSDGVVGKLAATGAVGTSVAPASIYPLYLTTHGFAGISLAEWFQILGAAYVFVLLGKQLGLWRAIGSLLKR